MRETGIKVPQDLHERASRCATRAGYSSTEEFVVHAIEKEVARMEDDDTGSENPAKSLRGIGYLDAGADI